MSSRRSRAYVKKCSYNQYFDENTLRCHPCIECLPPHQAHRFCDQCSGSTTAATTLLSISYISTTTQPSSSPAVATVVGAVVGLVFVLVIVVGLAICLCIRRRRQQRQPVRERVTDNLINNGERTGVELQQIGSPTVHGVSSNGISDPSIQHATSNVAISNGRIEPTSSNIQQESGCPLRKTATAPSSGAQPFIMPITNQSDETDFDDLISGISQPTNSDHGMICPSSTLALPWPNETPCKRHD